MFALQSHKTEFSILVTAGAFPILLHIYSWSVPVILTEEPKYLKLKHPLLFILWFPGLLLVKHLRQDIAFTLFTFNPHLVYSSKTVRVIQAALS
jgi:hypothetical protein